MNFINHSLFLTGSEIDTTNYEDDCRIFGDFGWSIQGLLGLVCLTTLICILLIYQCYWLGKRFRDAYRRSWLIWLMDSSKQLFGQGALHIANLGAATTLTANTLNSYPCRWYMLHFFSDFVLVTLFSYLFLMLIQYILNKMGILMFESGNYGQDVSIVIWFYQLCLWVFIILLSKVCSLINVLFFMDALNYFGGWLLYPLRSYPKVELICVMVFVPLLLDTVQVWIMDNFLKQNDQDAYLGELSKKEGVATDSIVIPYETKRRHSSYGSTPFKRVGSLGYEHPVFNTQRRLNLSEVTSFSSGGIPLLHNHHQTNPCEINCEMILTELYRLVPHMNIRSERKPNSSYEIKFILVININSQNQIFTHIIDKLYTQINKYI